MASRSGKETEPLVAPYWQSSGSEGSPNKMVRIIFGSCEACRVPVYPIIGCRLHGAAVDPSDQTL